VAMNNVVELNVVHVMLNEHLIVEVVLEQEGNILNHMMKVLLVLIQLNHVVQVLY
jgi:hypothetical protein